LESWVIFPNRKVRHIPDPYVYLINHHPKDHISFKKGNFHIQISLSVASLSHWSSTPDRLRKKSNGSPLIYPTQTQGTTSLWHPVDFFDLSQQYARCTTHPMHDIKIEYMKKGRKGFFGSVDPARAHSPHVVLLVFPGFEDIPRSQKPPGLRDIDL